MNLKNSMHSPTKVCKKCGVEKSRTEFSKKSKQGDGLQPRCKPCCVEDTADWRNRQSQDRIRDLYYTRTYGITLHDFNQMFSNQRGQCLLCKKDLEIGYKTTPKAATACVDHCHSTGKVRGILCNECNRGLGYFKDNKETLMNAVKYLSGDDLTPEGGQ